MKSSDLEVGYGVAYVHKGVERYGIIAKKNTNSRHFIIPLRNISNKWTLVKVVHEVCP